MYVWMFGIGYGNEVFYGRTWEEFLSLCELLGAYFDLHEDKRLITYVHNLGYEFEYKDIKQLQQYSSKFFELYNKSMQYLDTVENLGHAFDSTEVMETVRQIVKQEKIDLSDSEAALDEMIKRVSDTLTDIDNHDEKIEGRDWYTGSQSRIVISSHF